MVKMYFLEKSAKKWSSFRKNTFFLLLVEFSTVFNPSLIETKIFTTLQVDPDSDHYCIQDY